MKYAIVIEKGSKSFGAYAPDLPGCAAVGESRGEVIKLIQEAIELHLQSLKEHGEEVPRHALGSMDTLKVMGIMFDRLYTLRNQLLHGGATWNGNVNRDQITQGTEIMGQVVPIVIHLMMNDHQRVWGDACYPVVD